MKLINIKNFAIIFLSFLAVNVAGRTYGNAQTESPNHILINEVKISGESSADEFIELYNPTGTDINIQNWDLKKTTKSGSVENIVTNMEGVIPSSGYFLIIPRSNCGETKTETCFKGVIEKDEEYTTNNYLAKDNGISLYDQNGNLVDKAGWGAAADFEGEVFQSNPGDNQSIERKIENGLVVDTGNNKNDFVLQNISSPMNSKSINQNPGNQENESDTNESENKESSGQGNNNGEQNGTVGGSTLSDSSLRSYLEKIIINELLLNPEDSDNENEFIELYNAGTQDVNLGGWTLEDKMGKTKVFTIPENTVLKALAYAVFKSLETKIVLNNSGDGAVLKDNYGKIKNETPVSGAAGEDEAYALKDDGTWIWTEMATPGAKNIINSAEKEKSETGEKELASDGKEKTQIEIAYDYSDGIIINEILPDPDGLDNKLNYEWIEIYNNSEKEIDLAGWMLDDIRGKGSKPYTIKESRKIKPRGYIVFSKEETGIILNNAEDEVNIIWPDGTVVDTVAYKKAKESFSFALLDSGKWDWNPNPSPGKENAASNASEKKENILAEEADEKSELDERDDVAFAEDDFQGFAENAAAEFVEINVDGARKLPKYSKVKISGVVSVSPGTFNDNTFYISGSGIQVFSYNKIFGGISLGDKVELFGKMSEVGQEKRLIVDSPEFIKILGHDNLLEPETISTGAVGEKYEGYLASIKGEVVSQRNNVFYVDDGNGQARVYIKPETGIKIPEIEIGKTVNITGIISRTSLGYRILPRFQNDVKIDEAPITYSKTENTDNSVTSQNVNSGGSEMPLYYYGFMAAVLVVFVDWGRMKAKR